MRKRKSMTYHDPSILGGNCFVAPSILKWAQSHTGSKSSTVSIKEIGCWRWRDYPTIALKYQEGTEAMAAAFAFGILPWFFFGEKKWSVAPSILKWKRASTEANASNWPLEEMGYWSALSYFHSWIPRGYGSSGGGHRLFWQRNAARGDDDDRQTSSVEEGVVVLQYW